MTDLSTGLAERILKMATSSLPVGRAVWGQAMTAEFDVLQDRKLSWAIGCLISAMRWRILDAWPLLLAAVAAGGAIDFLMWLVVWLAALLFGGWHLSGIAIYAYWLAAPALACCALAAWRPRYAFPAAIVFASSRAVTGAILFASLVHGSVFSPRFHIMDGPPIVGLSAVVGWCLLGAAIGRHIGASYRSRAAGVKPRIESGACQ